MRRAEGIVVLPMLFLLISYPYDVVGIVVVYGKVEMDEWAGVMRPSGHMPGKYSEYDSTSLW